MLGQNQSNEVKNINVGMTTKERHTSFFKRFTDYLKNPGINQIDLSIIVAMIGFFVLLFLLSMPISEAITKETEISYGYCAKQDEQGLFYVVDSGHSRLLCFDKDSKIVSILTDATAGKGGNLYIDDFTTADGLTYISASEWNGMLLKREVIAVFDGSRYVNTISERDYSNIAVNKHRFFGINVEDNVLSYAETLENAIVTHHIELDNGKESTEHIFFDNAFNAVNDCAFKGETLYVLDKKGEITEIDNESREKIYTTSVIGERNRVPYKFVITKNGEIYMTDIWYNEIVKINPDTQRTIVEVKDVSSLTVNFTSDRLGILYLEDDGLIVQRRDSITSYKVLQKPLLLLAKQGVWLFIVFLSIVSFVIIIIRVAILLIKRKQTRTQKASILVISVVAIVSFTLCWMLINNFSIIYREKLMEQIENNALVIANQIPEGTIEQINRAEDYDTVAYSEIIEVMKKVFSYDVDFNRQLYCNILRLSEDGKRAFAIAYLDQSIGTYYPLDDDETNEVIKIYDNSDEGDVIWNNSVSDVSGTYLSVKVPIYENGIVVGVVAAGSETYVIRELIEGLQIQILLSITVILMLIWLAMSEGVAWVTNQDNYRKLIQTGRTDALPGHLIRLLVFAVFACYNMTATFLPIWILKNTNIFGKASQDFMASLPITVNIFVIGIMSLFTAEAVRRVGIKRILTISTICSLFGNAIMYLFPSYISAFIGLTIDGIGVGLITNATYVLLTYIKNEEDQQWGFTLYNTAYLAGMNFGMLLGSLLAVMVGQRIVFAIVAFVWLALMFSGNFLVRQLQGIISTDGTEENEASEDKSITTHRFVMSKPILSFIVLLQNPYILFNSFVFYFVPLFCGDMGYDETVISMLIMLYSEIAVLTGEMMTQTISKQLGNRGMYLAYVTNIVALIVFAIMQNMIGLVLALILLGIAAAYGKPLQQTWFLKQNQVKQYGNDRAMGVYNFSENIGESLGPIVISRLMSQKPLFAAVSAFCGTILACGGGHYVLNRRGLRELE